MTEPGFMFRADGLTVSATETQVSVLRLGRLDDETRQRLSTAFETTWPTEPNTVAQLVAWLGPREWALFGDPERTVTLVATACNGVNFHLANVGPGRRLWRIEGERAGEVMMRGAALDFRPNAFGHGVCAQTLFAQIHVLIMRRSAAWAFELLADECLTRHLQLWFERLKSEL